MNISSVLIALFLLVITVLVIFFFWKRKNGKRLDDALNQFEESKKPKKKEKTILDCPLNEIMGYDFIKIITPPTIQTEQVKHFADIINDGKIEQSTIGVVGTETINEKEDAGETVTDEQARYISLGKKEQQKAQETPKTKDNNKEEETKQEEQTNEEDEEEVRTYIDKDVYEACQQPWPFAEEELNEKGTSSWLDSMMDACGGYSEEDDTEDYYREEGNVETLKDNEDQEEMTKTIQNAIDKFQDGATNDEEQQQFLAELENYSKQ